MFKDGLDTHEKRISEWEDRSEEITSKEVQGIKGQNKIWEKIRNMDDRVKGFISYAEREDSKNVAINNIWLHIAWKYFITDESPKWIDIKVQRISIKRNKNESPPIHIVMKDRYITTRGGKHTE